MNASEPIAADQGSSVRSPPPSWAELTGRIHTALAGYDGPLAVAFSGGSDSLALTAAAVRWASVTRRPVTALIVDHGLRAGSGVDAARAGWRARALGVPAEIVRWEGEKPSTGIQDAARNARHRLISSRCRQLGAGAVLFGHTADDQAETLAMRRTRNPAAAAVLGMRVRAPSPVWPEGRALAVVRPFLDVSRSSLQARLSVDHMSWIDDPANQNRAFERIRVRDALAQNSAMTAQLLADGHAAIAEEDALNRAAKSVFARSFQLYAGGWAELNMDLLINEGRVGVRALEAALWAVSGRPTPLGEARLARLLGEAIAPDFVAATLGGTHMRAVSKRVRLIVRDAGAACGRADGASGGQLLDGVWDGRFELDTQEPNEQVRALGCFQFETIQKNMSPEAAAYVARTPRAARPSLPVTYMENKKIPCVSGRWLGPQLAARRLVNDQVGPWSDDIQAQSALGVGVCEAHVKLADRCSLERNLERPT